MLLATKQARNIKRATKVGHLLCNIDLDFASVYMAWPACCLNVTVCPLVALSNAFVPKKCTVLSCPNSKRLYFIPLCFDFFLNDGSHRYFRFLVWLDQRYIMGCYWNSVERIVGTVRNNEQNWTRMCFSSIKFTINWIWKPWNIDFICVCCAYVLICWVCL